MYKAKALLVLAMILTSMMAVEASSLKERESFLKPIFEPITCGICKTSMGGFAGALLSQTSIKFFEKLIYLG